MQDNEQHSFRHNIKRAGGIGAVARLTGYGYQAVYVWYKAGGITREKTREEIRRRGINPYNLERY